MLMTAHILIEFTDISRGRLKRDGTGRLVVDKILKPGLTNGGQSDYHEQNTNGGILFSQIDLKARPDVFQVYSTGVWAAHKPAGH